MSAFQQILLGTAAAGGGPPPTVAAEKRQHIIALNRQVRHLVLGYPGVIPGVKVRLNTNLGSLVTESGDGTAGWNYAGTGTNGFAQNFCAASNQKLASGVNGFCSTVLAASGDLSSRPFVFGFYSTQITTDYQTPVAAIGCNANVYEQYASASSNTPNGAVGVAVANAHVVRLTRTGTTILAEVFISGSWVLIHTFTGVSTGDVYAHAFVSASVHCNNISSDVMA